VLAVALKASRDMPHTIVASLAELDGVVEYVSSIVPDDAIIFLTGDLASGKTTLAKSLALSRGFTGEVTSPTFSLQHCYGDRLYHYDLYRIEYEEFVSLGLFEELDRAGWHLIEWGMDKLKSALQSYGYECYEISIEPVGDIHRQYTIGRVDA